ncbi:hypothetical protein EDB92DRAFT_810645 [Lactarius akahatsu]|uniref:Uncharacterized protein n=1 Tax=Lactarius akahatsu TaxID=416441 RepID=A0AAD4LF01_9AGAM|nr:hypothetical protein EDB92DRAFT_810645 [Lactarius akahatsu]
MSTHAAFASPPETSSHFAYDFLAYPPSPRTRPVELPPTPTVRAKVRHVSRRRSSTISTISSWATQLLPGSHEYAPGGPSTSTPVLRRPSLFRSPCSARRLSATFLSFIDTPTHTHKHTPDLRTPDYAPAIVPLPVTPRTAAPRLQSTFPSKRDNDYHADMKFTLALPRQRQGSFSASPLPSTPSKKKRLMRFLRPGPHPRSVTKTPGHRQVSYKMRPQSPPPSPTTAAAFSIAHRKRIQYARHGALPLPLESEVELMQFTDGGSRANAIARLGAGAYTDAAGIVYADEAEAGECLPLLLAPDSTDDSHSAIEDVFVFASSAPSSPVAPFTPPAPVSAATLPPRTPTSAEAQAIAFSPRALLSIPARAGSGLSGDAGAPAYMHVMFDPPSASPVRGRAQRRRPPPLVLSLPAPTGLRPASVIGFDDSFMPGCVAVSEASVVRDTEMGFRGLLRATRRE